MKKLKVLFILFSIITIVSVAVLATNFSHITESASAEVQQVQQDYLYKFDNPLPSVNSSWQSGTVSTSQDVALSSNYTIYKNDPNAIDTTFIDNNIIAYRRTASSTNSSVQYTLHNGTSISNSTKRLVIRFDNNNSAWSITILDSELINGSWTNVSFDLSDFSLTFSSISSNNQYINYFFNDLAKIVHAFSTSITLNSGYYVLDTTAPLTHGDGINIDFELWKGDNGNLSAEHLTGLTGLSVGYPWGPDPDSNSKTINAYNSTTRTELTNSIGSILKPFYIKILYDTQVPSNSVSNALIRVPDGALHNIMTTYSIGFNEGVNYSLIENGTGGVIGALFSGLFGQIFAVEIFPGFPLYIFVLIPVVFTIITLVLWLMRGK